MILVLKNILTIFLCIIEWPEVYEEELYGLNYHTMSIVNTGENREVSFD
jgi:tRNA threonylcarbamoyladenosine biosynthesis protein TsaE